MKKQLININNCNIKVKILIKIIGYKIGDIITIRSINMGDPDYFYDDINYKGKVFYSNQIKEIDMTKKEIEEENEGLLEDIQIIKNKIEENKSKIKFMKENKLDKFDETDFKVFKTLETLDMPNLSNIEKAKIISELIKNQ